MLITTENILLIGSILFFISILIGKTGSRLGLPVLLLFLIIGMVAGKDGVGIEFESPATAQFIGVISLSIILFSGGMDTKIEEIRPVVKQGILLATFGVLLTTLFTGGFIYLIANWTFPGHIVTLTGCMLLAAVMSSTDSASVFNILRSKNLNLKHNLRPLLELESGSNDPMAYMLTIILIQIIQIGEIHTGQILLSFAIQFLVGIFAGYLLGMCAVWILNHIKIDNPSLYQIILLTFVFFTFSFTTTMQGNGYLAVYIAGLVVGNRRIVYKKYIANFFDGLAWLFQIIMFLALGLLVNPRELIDVAWIGLLVGIFMIIIARPVSVLLCLLPFRWMTFNSRLFVSWIGLRGAVPIIFATYPLLAGIPEAKQIFNIVFFITLLSLLIQGTTVPSSAKLLKLSFREKKIPKAFEMELPEEVKSIMSEITITRDMLSAGDYLINLPLPENTLVVLVKRFGRFFVPNGCSQLFENDQLLIISDNEKDLKEIYETLGVEDYTITKN
ncbi:MAG: potassium/proton antiporter [Odoribacter splanchnicus]|nr:potassium/proton antiporter [Odoribacter splanchnicus]